MPRKLASLSARLAFGLVVFAVLALAITNEPTKRLIDFDQSFYLTIAYDLDRHGVFSNGKFDDTDSTTAAPAPGMFFTPLFPWVVVAAMKVDARFAQAVVCSVEADHHKRDLSTCDIYARPIHIIHAILLALGVLAVAAAAEAIFAGRTVFFLAGVLATVSLAAKSELLSYIMTESATFFLYSVMALAFVHGLKSSRWTHFAVAGLVLATLCLLRASYLALVPVLSVLIVVNTLWVSPRQARSAGRSVIALCLGFSVVVAPWVVRNVVSIGKASFTEEYGSLTLVERLAFNDMTLGEFVSAVPYCIPQVGPPVARRLIGDDVIARFEWDRPGSFFEAGRARRFSLVDEHKRVDPIIGDLLRTEMERNWWRHLLTTVPLAWCGMLAAGLPSVLLVPLFGWACVEAVRRAKPLFLLYALPPLVMVVLHAALANHYPRYNLGLIGPIAAGSAWVLVMAARSLAARRRSAQGLA
jgi:hypothetical protein